MTKAAFNSALEVRQPYLSMVYMKIPGESTWTLVDQGRVVSPAQTAATQEYKRIGDKLSKKVPGTVSTEITVNFYLEDDIEEVAHLLGFVKPVSGGWTGAETIELDPSKKIDLKIENYNGTATGSALLFTEYINEFQPGNLTPGLDAEGDVRIVELSGSAYSYYIIPAAALGA
jgi:hypothetical protein